MKDEILEKIRTDEVTMRPKAYFVIKLTAVVLVALAILVVSIIILNFISFTIRINGHDSLLGFGFQGFLLFLGLFPWLLLIIDIGLIIVLEWVLKQFHFGNKIPVLYLLLAILIVTVTVGFLLDRGTSFNDEFLLRADKHALPSPFSNYFEGARQRPSQNGSTCRCLITAINGDNLSVEDLDSEATTDLSVIIPSNKSHITTNLIVGDVVFVAGQRYVNSIKAFGISQFPTVHHN